MVNASSSVTSPSEASVMCSKSRSSSLRSCASSSGIPVMFPPIGPSAICWSPATVSAIRSSAGAQQIQGRPFGAAADRALPRRGCGPKTQLAFRQIRQLDRRNAHRILPKQLEKNPRRPSSQSPHLPGLSVALTAGGRSSDASFCRRSFWVL